MTPGITAKVSRTAPMSGTVSTYDGHSHKIGELSFERGRVKTIRVNVRSRRQGIATWMYALGSAAAGRPLAHSGNRSPAGSLWAPTVGGPLPRLWPECRQPGRPVRIRLTVSGCP